MRIVEIPIMSCPDCKEGYTLADWCKLRQAEDADDEHDRRICTCGRRIMVPRLILEDAEAVGGFKADAAAYADLFPMSERPRHALTVTPTDRWGASVAMVAASFALLFVLLCAIAWAVLR